jgi:hypothetical protein
MAARDHGDMPLGGKPNLPQFRTPKADIVSRHKAQNFAFGAGGAVRVERYEDTEGKLDDPRAHVSRCRGCPWAVHQGGPWGRRSLVPDWRAGSRFVGCEIASLDSARTTRLARADH